MWIPKSEEEIVAAVNSGSLEESSIFDAKRELPTKNLEIAKDIAAMANDGGVLIYGIGEDKDGRPTTLNPVPLADQPERVTNIVQTSLAEPPVIRIKTIPTAEDQAKGYLVAAVPPSERAPHMVQARGHNRYYGRTAKGNTPLSEGEVARLYERRRRWEVDRDAMLGREIDNALLPPHDGFARLHIVARPLLTSEEFLNRATGDDQDTRKLLITLLKKTLNSELVSFDYEPNFSKTTEWIVREDGYLGRLSYSAPLDQPQDPGKTLYLQVDFDGGGHLCCGRAAQMYDGKLLLFPYLVAGNTTKFIALLGELYAGASYVGMVDIGIAVTDLRGAVPDPGHFPSTGRTIPYDRDEYRSTSRSSAWSLKDDPRSVAKKLLKRLFDALSQGRLDPFSE